MAFLALPPHAALSPLVMGYWFIEDLEGSYEGKPIRTTPHAGAVLTLNFGRPCASEFAAGAPRASLLGIQSHPRNWSSGEGCSFVMVMLRPPGLARLFPALGKDSRDDMLELGGVLGDGAARRLCDDLAAAWAPRRVAARLDDWLLRRLSASRALVGVSQLGHAWATLLRTSRVDEAAREVSVSRRQLERWFSLYAGHTPKQLLGLDRIQSSLHAAQTGKGDPLQGFSDQAHQIRQWRRHLGMTPGRYSRASKSILAEYFAQARDAAPEGLAHFF
ncbi:MULTISPECIES: helix-turn-helix domain-containing protein [unclassified Myxococcus]|uniref:helix-turn-helix domain-containing protein n=1 Tax=unclassified Myxococcus TaxID=2648731 RepID=UPI00157B3A6A|nr:MULTISPECIES: helix-turn-helix domain-containing protein [unclassified Myxococcus]NTX33883.1 AraC family transcriptional regulator [Myxococcus sp. CA033]NTX52160.1 AraC family transcriptional regulator [Myxococcus sp. CA039A]